MNTKTDYKCAQCGETYGYGWSDEEAKAEAEANGFDLATCVLVCDDCYNEIMGELSSPRR